MVRWLLLQKQSLTYDPSGKSLTCWSHLPSLKNKILVSMIFKVVPSDDMIPSFEPTSCCFGPSYLAKLHGVLELKGRGF